VISRIDRAMTVTCRARTSVLTIGLVGALLGSACGGSDDTAGGDSVATPTTEATSIDSSTSSDYRTLGIAPVFPGDSAELFAVSCDGSVATEVGLFGIAVQYLGGSDDYNEGLDESDLGAFEFDCSGLSL